MPEVAEAKQTPERRMPKDSIVNQMRQRIFGNIGVAKKMIADKSEVNIRRSNTGEWVTGRAIKYVQERNTVVVEWEVSGKMKDKEVEIDEFIRWQKGEIGENADSQGF